jgi:hypothetical protein
MREVQSLGAAPRSDAACRPTTYPSRPRRVWDRIVRELEQPGGAGGHRAAGDRGARRAVTELRPRTTGWRARSRSLLLPRRPRRRQRRLRPATPRRRPCPQPPQPVASASLKPFDEPASSGTAVISQASTAQRTVTVTVTGLPQRAGAFYEVWLMDPSNAHLVALGVLDSSGHGQFAVPAGLDLASYSAVDVSLQPMNGSPLHSGDSQCAES